MSMVSLGIVVEFDTLDAEVVDINVGGTSTDTPDVSHQGSSPAYRGFLAGLTDGGEVTLTINFDPTTAVIPAEQTEDALILRWVTGAAGPPVVHPREFEADAILTGKSAAAPLGDVVRQDLTFKITGPVQWTLPDPS